MNIYLTKDKVQIDRGRLNILHYGKSNKELAREIPSRLMLTKLLVDENPISWHLECLVSVDFSESSTRVTNREFQ